MMVSRQEVPIGTLILQGLLHQGSAFRIGVLSQKNTAHMGSSKAVGLTNLINKRHFSGCQASFLVQPTMDNWSNVILS